MTGVGVVQRRRPRWEDDIIEQRDKQGRGGRGFPHTTIHQNAAAIAPEIVAAIVAAISAAIATAIAAAIAAAIAVETAAAANNDVGNQQCGRWQG